MITPEQAEQIKRHLLGQINNFPEDQRDVVKKKILSMTNEELEAFIKQNQLTHLEDEASKEKCIFCLIVEGKIPSYKLDENQENIAILEINPLSKGHTLIVPKKHLNEKEIPSSAFILAKKIETKLQEKFKPQEIQINPQVILGHALLEVLPIYGDETERHKATQEELEELKKILETKQEPIVEKKQEEIPIQKKEIPTETIPILKPRIP
jgi:diadenosine tetraphosphate (Ap4A) HIT family hydrolase